MGIMRDWIGIRLKELGKTKGALAAHLGVAPARMTEFTKGRRELQSSEIIPFAEFLELSPTKVLHLLSDPKADLGSVEIGNVSPSERELGKIPIRGEVAAGLWREHDDVAQELDEPAEYAPTILAPTYPKDLQFALIVRGESLNKIAPDGSTLHCVEYIDGGSWDLADGELVIVQRSKFQGQMIETTAKRVRKKAGWELWPESDHPDFQEPLKVADYQTDDCTEEIRILAKVISITRSP